MIFTYLIIRYWRRASKGTYWCRRYLGRQWLRLWNTHPRPSLCPKSSWEGNTTRLRRCLPQQQARHGPNLSHIQRFRWHRQSSARLSANLLPFLRPQGLFGELKLYSVEHLVLLGYKSLQPLSWGQGRTSMPRRLQCTGNRQNPPRQFQAHTLERSRQSLPNTMQLHPCHSLEPARLRALTESPEYHWKQSRRFLLRRQQLRPMRTHTPASRWQASLLLYLPSWCHPILSSILLHLVLLAPRRLQSLGLAGSWSACCRWTG